MRIVFCRRRLSQVAVNVWTCLDFKVSSRKSRELHFIKLIDDEKSSSGITFLDSVSKVSFLDTVNIFR